jgi:hypothetical protein
MGDRAAIQQQAVSVARRGVLLTMQPALLSRAEIGQAVAVYGDWVLRQ